jgi:DNA polymerase-3 subunit delta'
MTTRLPVAFTPCRSPGFTCCAGASTNAKRPQRRIFSVREVRKMKGYFALSAADGGRRVAIVDAADEMNSLAAANALLKLLEEPPPGNVTFFLISHQPSRLLPTIRSRCRELRLAPCPPPRWPRRWPRRASPGAPRDPEAMAELAGGSVGEAVRVAQSGWRKLYRRADRAVPSLPRLDRGRACWPLPKAAHGKRRRGAFDLIVTLLDLLLARLARSGTLGQTPPEAAPGEAALIARLAPDPAAARAWADLAQSLSAAGPARQGGQP